MVYLLFFLSGAAGLIYEISWSRQIGLLLGNTVNASAVVLGAYFCGMSVGYLYAARTAPRLRRPLLGYAGAEFTVALWALATPLLLGLLRAPEVAQLLNSDTIWLQTTSRAVVSLLVLLPATAALGATFPFIAQHLSPPAAPRPQAIAQAYGWNTAGAMAGVLAATFFLLLYAGVVHSSFIAAGISGACGSVALLLGGARKAGRVSVPARDSDSATSSDRSVSGGHGDPPHPLSPSLTGTYLLAAISGFGTLALQVLYTRLFALVFHNSTYTFGGIVAVFLIALAGSSWLAGTLAQRYPPQRLLAQSALLGGLGIPASVLLMQKLTGLQYFNPPGGFAAYIFGSLALISTVILVPVTLLGLILPLLWSGARDSGASGKVVGKITSVNTLAATLGALLASFVLLPQLGLWLALDALALLYVLTGLLLALRLHELRRLALAALLLTLPQLALVGRTEQLHRAEAQREGYRFLYQRDTAYGEIDVIEKDGVCSLRENRHYTLGSSAGERSEFLQGQLPLQLHPLPQRVCYLGLATGITASAALADEDVEKVTVVELVPAVVDAAGLFAQANHDVAHDPRVDIVINDARYYMYAGGLPFDVIVSDLFVPWHSQTGYLYTVENYRACKKHLMPGGVFCQWLPLYQLSPREFECIANSFASVFPDTLVFLAGTPDEPLIGLAGGKSALSPPTAAAAVPRQYYIGQWPAHPGALLNTDEHPRVEFLAPISQRAGQLLSGARFADYKRRVLDHL